MEIKTPWHEEAVEMIRQIRDDYPTVELSDTEQQEIVDKFADEFFHKYTEFYDKLEKLLIERSSPKEV